MIFFKILSKIVPNQKNDAAPSTLMWLPRPLFLGTVPFLCMPSNFGPEGQNGPAQGPDSGGMGMSNEQLEEFMRIQPVCENPEQCQQMQQQMQNQMIPQQPCKGEGCNYGPPPEGQPVGQQPLQPQLPAPAGQNYLSQTQPAPQLPAGGYPSQITAPSPNESMSSGGSMPTGPYLNQPQPQPQQYQQPPQQPAPGGTTPPPSGFLSPDTFLGSIISIFNQTLHLEK